MLCKYCTLAVKAKHLQSCLGLNLLTVLHQVQCVLQSQSITVDRQMRRYDVPRLAFINKCDRAGADPIRVLNQMRDKLKLNCSPVQLPLGLEDKLRGLIDVVEQRAYSFGGPFGNEITEVRLHLH